MPFFYKFSSVNSCNHRSKVAIDPFLLGNSFKNLFTLSCFSCPKLFIKPKSSLLKTIFITAPSTYDGNMTSYLLICKSLRQQVSTGMRFEAIISYLLHVGNFKFSLLKFECA